MRSSGKSTDSLESWSENAFREQGKKTGLRFLWCLGGRAGVKFPGHCLNTPVKGGGTGLSYQSS